MSESGAGEQNEISDKRRIGGRDEVRNAIISVLGQASHRIQIVAPILDPYNFNNEEVTSLLTSFAVAHPRNSVRILVEDGDGTVRYNSRLVAVARKLGDFVQIRQPGEIHSLGMEMRISIDTTGYLIQPDHTKPACIVDLQDRNSAAKYLRQFDEMWQIARYISSINVVGL
jgi:predicted NodU family carbamoyl transferase